MNAGSSRSLVSLCIFLTLLGICYSPVLANNWAVQTVDSAGDVGESASLAIYGNTPRIAYCDYTNSGFKYAEWNGSWSISSVDTSIVCRYTRLALDPTTGRPRIAYADETNWALKYAAWNGLSWETQTVDTVGNGSRLSLVLDSSGNPRIAYQDRERKDLMYAAWNGSTWTTETVDSAGITGWDPSLVLDASGRPRITYSGDDGGYSQKYAEWNGTSWDIQTVYSGMGIVGLRTAGSLALDSSGKPRILFPIGNPGDLKYAAWNGSAWDIETVAVVAGHGCSLLLNADDDPEIAYTSPLDGNVWYRTKSGDHWGDPELVSVAVSQCETSLALDGGGNRWIAFFDGSEQDLKLATIPEAATVPEPLTILALFSGCSGLGIYLRKHRLA